MARKDVQLTRERAARGDATSVDDLVGAGDSPQHTIDLDFDAGDAVDMRPGDLSSSTGTLVYSTDTGVVTVNYWAAEVVFGLGCQTAGVGFGSS